MDQRHLLLHHDHVACVMPLARFRMEKLQALREARALSHHTGNSEVSHHILPWSNFEMQGCRLNLPDYRPRKSQFSQAIKKIRALQRTRRNRGFAFSQTEESQERIIRSYDTTVPKAKG